MAGAGPAVSTPEAPLPAAAWVPAAAPGPATAAAATVAVSGLGLMPTNPPCPASSMTQQLLGASHQPGAAPSPPTPQVSKGWLL